ncbi:phage tail protein I [Sphingomonas sp.]|uniref:phage tail protein I n=1 Tax=Sphingomonas sp. TaxID=28214 RepID=UPI002ED993DA
MSNAALLPPNATALERGLAAVTNRISDVPLPLSQLWDPATCPLHMLPWLAWAMSVDSWDPAWPEATKREAVANSIPEHRIKGTRAAIESVIGRFDDRLGIVEWHEATPRRDPHTFEVSLPLVDEDGVARGGYRASAAFANRLMSEIAGAKPLREHFTLLQTVAARGGIGVQGVARAFAFSREQMTITVDESQPWASLLQDENGEPLQDDAGDFLDGTL